MKATSKLLMLFGTVLSFTGVCIGAFTRFSGLPLLFAAFYIIDRADSNINVLPKNKVWRSLMIGVVITYTLIEVGELLTS